jgi:hypothetical protein
VSKGVGSTEPDKSSESLDELDDLPRREASPAAAG